jgi:para-nitrobenzyl esterase
VRGVSIPILPDPGFELGAVHSGELNALFPGFSNTAAMTAPDLSPASQKLADHILATWAAFMRGTTQVADGGRGMATRFEPAAVQPFDAWAEYQCDFWRSAFPASFGTREAPPKVGAAGQSKKMMR